MNDKNENNFLPIDQAFADFILRLSGTGSDETVKEIILELSAAVRSGASCLELSEEKRKHLIKNCSRAIGVYPENGLSLPLLLDGKFLYFQKLLKFEIKLAELLFDIASRPVPDLPADTVDDIFADLQKNPALSPAQLAAIDTQKEAVRRSLSKPLAVISGGPGTGKTTVASALLAMELQRTSPNKIALLAPTGKAHVRLKESLLEDSKKFNIPDETRTLFAELPGGTIHRFLGWGKDKTKYSADNPAPFDLVLVDECSMISLHTMTTLLSALPAHTRVVLLGDDAQLSSIDAGLVFSDLCRASVEATSGPLHGIVSNLVYNFRAEKAAELIDLAQNLRQGRLPEKMVFQSTPTLKNFAAAFENIIDAARQICNWCKENTAQSLDEAFKLLDEYKIICPVTKNVNWGTGGINKTVLKTLELEEHSAGVPIMIRHNNYDLELFNGDTGLIIPGKKAVFPGKAEPFPLAVLPEYDIAYAISAHKSQGSGYQHICLLLPDEEHPLLNRPLIYTAVTRARLTAEIYGKREVIEKALSISGTRSSGLPQRLLDLNSKQ